MPVFISHRTADDAKATSIAYRLRVIHNINCYVDDLDPLTRTTKKITDLILSRIASCTHILALVTDNTIGSWWVPFEVGVARQSERRISSYDSSSKPLPEYLDEWPVLRGDSAVDKFAASYHQDASKAKSLLESFSGKQAGFRPVSSPDEFHRSLKSALGQF